MARLASLLTCICVPKMIALYSSGFLQINQPKALVLMAIACALKV